MPRIISHLQKLLLLSIVANVCLLFLGFKLLSALQETYTDYRHFRALPIGTSSATSITADQIDQSKKTIVLFGDSRIETWYPLPQAENTAFINAGVTGETTSEMLRRYERDVVRLRPRYVLIQAGVNDLTAAVTKGVKNSQELVDTMQVNMQYFISDLESQGIDVIVTSILPNKHLNFTRKLFWHNTLSEKVAQANAKLKQTTESLNADWFDLDPFYLDQNGDPVNELFFDTLHINNGGYEVLNSELHKYLNTLSTQ